MTGVWILTGRYRAVAMSQKGQLRKCGPIRHLVANTRHPQCALRFSDAGIQISWGAFDDQVLSQIR
jgi:hypothetical protein